MQVRRTKVGGRQLLFLSLRCGAGWFGLTLSSDAEPRTLQSSQTPIKFFSKFDFEKFLTLLHVGKATSILPCSSPKFLSETYLFISAFLETLLYGRPASDGGCCQSPDRRQRSDTAVSEVCV